MFKTYQKYIFQEIFYKNFYANYIIFFSLTVILGSLELNFFFEKILILIFYPYYLTLLNIIDSFEMFPYYYYLLIFIL